MIRLEYHSGARRDIREAIAWYERESPQAALRFLDSLEAAFQNIARNPARFPPFSRRSQRLVLQDFPFSVIYRRSPDAVTIIAVAHAKRRPGYWKKRL
jgi:plasmid stabilization system protein ParE